MRLTVRQMEVIHAVSHYGSVTEAARALGISQPAVSLMLRDCGTRAGFPFFVHKHGRLQATHETLKLLDSLDRVFDSIEHVNCLVNGMREVASGTVRVVTSATLADNLVAPAGARFRSARPDIQISVEVLYNNLAIAEGVHQGQADFGIVLSPLIGRDGRLLEARLVDICAADLICIVPPRNRLAAHEVLRPRDIAPYPLISFERHLPLGALIEDSYDKEGIKRVIAVNVTSTSMAYSLVRAGAGVAIVDPFYQLSHQDEGVVTTRYEPGTEVKVQILLPNNTSISRPARLFVEALRRQGGTLRELASRVVAKEMTNVDGSVKSVLNKR